MQDAEGLRPRTPAAGAAGEGEGDAAEEAEGAAGDETVTTDEKPADLVFASLNAFRDAVWEVSSSKGFKDEPVTVATMTANIHGEVSELWESYRADTLEMPCDKAEKMAALGLPRLTCAVSRLRTSSSAPSTRRRTSTSTWRGPSPQSTNTTSTALT